MPEQNYGAQNIQVLEGLDAVRNARGCISAVRLYAAYIISYMK